MRVLTVCLVLASVLASNESSAQVDSVQLDSALKNTIWEQIRDIVPRTYIAQSIDLPVTIDGHLDEEAWSLVEWSSDFVDIEGVAKPKPALKTRMKIVWNQSYLYIAAEMTEPHLWATLSEKNSVIFHDDDFEVFIDPDSDNHNYYEFEMNAYNTIWELRLVRPYRDGGPAISGENMSGLVSAVALDGSINDPSDWDDGWTIELGIPWKEFGSYDADRVPPQSGDRWRVNFSRVDHRLDIYDEQYQKRSGTAAQNWVWSPQGVIDMHVPERWGFVQFGDVRENAPILQSSMDWPERECLMEIYHRQKAYRSIAGRYSSELKSLLVSTDRHPFPISLTATDSTFVASILVSSETNNRRAIEIGETGRIITRPN